MTNKIKINTRVVGVPSVDSKLLTSSDCDDGW